MIVIAKKLRNRSRFRVDIELVINVPHVPRYGARSNAHLCGGCLEVVAIN
jgi:hypothetical protein